MKIIHYSIMHVCVRALLQELPSLGVLIIMRNILTCSGKELTTLHSLENKKSLRLYSAAHITSLHKGFAFIPLVCHYAF